MVIILSKTIGTRGMDCVRGIFVTSLLLFLFIGGIANSYAYTIKTSATPSLVATPAPSPPLPSARAKASIFPKKPNAQPPTAPIVIKIPPKPKGFPTAFPQYCPCYINGKRQACYNKEGVKQLLKIWSRLQLLERYPGLAKQHAEALNAARGVIRSQKQALAERKKASAEDQKQIAALRKQLEQERKRKKWETIKTALIYTGVAIGAAATGVVVGYVAASLSK